jgi:hypothetical protein
MNVSQIRGLLSSVSDEDIEQMIRDIKEVEDIGTFDSSSKLVAFGNRVKLISGQSLEGVLPYITVTIFREFAFRKLNIN